MSWLDTIASKCPDLLQGASLDRIREVEGVLKVQFPKDVVEFLHWRDGGQIADRRYILYSAGLGIHPTETLLAANDNRQLDTPFLFIGRDAGEEFGFKKSELVMESPPIYFYLHEEEKLDKVADSFREFIESLLAKNSPYSNF